MNRDEILSYITDISESTGSRLKDLVEKEGELEKKGNKYGEMYTKRQFDLAVEPILNTEYIRCKIVDMTRTNPMAVKEIANKLELPTRNVLKHITILQRRNLITINNIKDRIPIYRGLVEETKESNKDEKNQRKINER
jgi:hypothetical protein